eukprot:TRINITY_DN14956_c0_g1_i1.p1 TRINITY_DN14956_c0_g1~~TRINITY_DN14956_c0_g1_i1.p1  ORF type:complete len:805 (+),score=327.31 TRINITY_DN14956_c0_g1_i1:240-2417(+)
MDAMKRLIAMMSKGRDVSSVFPSVVKNVISKNVELKKLVYMYLVHYAEQEQDNALLAINTFQKDLSNQSQYIRASALRVMSGIRVKIIVQIIIMAIQKGAKDSSAYVRKTAAHAIPKVCAMDPDHREELVEIIKGLLADKATLVLGSAVAAWMEVCPERVDLIHPHFRKLCHLLSDIDEWGQIIVLEILTRYSRTQFVDPNRAKKEKENKPPKEKKPAKKKTGKWLDSDDEDSDDDDFDGPVDPDLRLLLDRSAPLLKSRNTAVVLGVSTLYFYCAPTLEIPKVMKSLVRISKGSREVEYIVLANINTMASNRPELFEPFLSEFFVKPSDSSFIRMLKLEIISTIATQDNINKILKELKTYISREEKDFVAATIQAIGRCAISVPDVADRCLGGLTSMLTNKSETVVAESVVVIKTLLQAMMEKPNEETVQTVKEVLTSISKLVDTLDSPRARSSIVWAIGEYADKIPLVAPDVLRKLAKSFPGEDPSVKLQALNLGSKLQFTNKEQTSKIFDYILSMAKYDSSYDVRDRCRVLRSVLSVEGSSSLSTIAQSLVQNKKPVPQYSNPNEGRKRFMLGSLSHIVNHTANGYEPIADFPEEAPDSSVRDEQIAAAKQDEPDFWSEGSGSETESGSGSDFYSDESEASGSEESEGSEEEESEEEDEDEEDEEEEEEEESEEEPPVKSASGKDKDVRSPKQNKREDFEDLSDDFQNLSTSNKEEDFEEFE